MPLTILKTLDESNTLYHDEFDETYHSRNGAWEESMHVFIRNGFLEEAKEKERINILEMGFGTGLNAILTFLESSNSNIIVYYHGLETYPLDLQILRELNYEKHIEENFREEVQKIYESNWNEDVKISEHFTLMKQQLKLQDFIPRKMYDLIYFDAFSPGTQPELWTKEIFIKLYDSLTPGGILVTYSSKGEVKRALREAGFGLERLKGSNGKRHMLRARKQE